MGCDIEVLMTFRGVRIGVLRGGEGFNTYGDAFTYAATVILKEKTLYLKGMVGVFPKTLREDIRKVLAKYNLDYITWEKYKKIKKAVKIRQVKIKREGSRRTFIKTE